MADYRFEVSFSYASAHRKLIQQVASLMQDRLGLGKVFYDDWFEAEIHGRDMHHELERVYCRDSRMVVVCLSKPYSDRPWCRHELEVIHRWIERLNASEDRGARRRIAFLRVDSTPFLELRDADAAYYVTGKGATEIADYLSQRHAKVAIGAPQPQSTPARPSLLSQARRWLRPMAKAVHPPAERSASPLEKGIAQTLPQLKCAAIDAVLLSVPVGTFLMGAPGEAAGAERRHHVSITKPFHLGTTPVTRAQWTRVMGQCPAGAAGSGEDHPVVNVSWEECDAFCERLTRLEGRRYRLPTEAEWEYACRAKSNADSLYLWGDDVRKGEGWANLYDQSGKRTHGYDLPAAPWDDTYASTSPVGQFYPNSIGLFDMIGNVWEWCADWFSPYPAGPVSDPSGPLTGTERVLRGSSWFEPPERARIAARHKAPSSRRAMHIGLRLAAD